MLKPAGTSSEPRDSQGKPSLSVRRSHLPINSTHSRRWRYPRPLHWGQGVCSAGKGRDNDLIGYLGQVADKYILSGGGPTSRQIAAPWAPLPPQGIHVLLAVLLLVWLAATTLNLPLHKALAMEHGTHKWWTLVTDAFYSCTGPLLARNLFMGYMFGRVVENTEGPQALWLTYILSSLGAGLLCCWLLPKRIPLAGAGMTGALWGLFLAATLFNRFKTWHWQRLVEMAVLAPFLLLQLLQGHATLAQWCSVYGARLGAWVPIAGGFMGAAAAAAIVHLVEAVMRGMRRGTASSKEGPAQGGQRSSQEDIEPLSVLLAQVASRFLKKVL